MLMTQLPSYVFQEVLCRFDFHQVPQSIANIKSAPFTPGFHPRGIQCTHIKIAPEYKPKYSQWDNQKIYCSKLNTEHKHIYHVKSINQFPNFELHGVWHFLISVKLCQINPQKVKEEYNFKGSLYISYTIYPYTQKIQELTISVSDTGPKLVT